MNQEQHEELARKLSAIEAPPPPEGLLDKLRADIPDEFPVANRTRVRHVTGWSLGLAASIMMMIGAAYFAVSYQKSATFEVAAPESGRSAVVPQKKSSSIVSASGTLQPTPAEAQSIEVQPNVRAEADRVEAKTLSKLALSEKRDDLAPPSPAAKPQVAYAPEAPPAVAAESRAMSGAEGSVEGGVAGGVVDGVAASRENESADSARNQAIAPQRNNAKDAAAPAAVAAAPAPAQMRMKSEAPPPVRVGGAIAEPRVLRKVDPILSGEAKRANVHGVVIVDTTIDRDGNVISTRLLKGLPYGVDDAVMDAVRRWKFEPTVIDGRAVTVVYEISVKIGE